MRPKRYPYVKKAKKQHTPKLVHEIEFVGESVVVDGVLFENVSYNLKHDGGYSTLSLELYAKIKSQR